MGKFYKGVAYIEDMQKYPCYSDNSDWNGWGIPYFTKETILRMISDSEITFDDHYFIFNKTYYDEEKDVFITDDDHCEDGYYESIVKDIIYNDETIRVYNIGNGWTWDIDLVETIRM